MLQGQFNNNLTLASLNARHSESPTPLDIYPRLWDTDFAFGLPPHPTNQYDFQSNSSFDAPVVDTHRPTTPIPLAGLGIHYPDPYQDLKLSFSPKSFSHDLSDQYLSFSPRLESNYCLNNPGTSLHESLEDVSQGLGELWPSVLGDNLNLSSITIPLPDLPLSAAVLPSESSHEDLSIEALSAAAGLSIEEFTAKITEGAQYALKHFAQIESLSDETTTAGEPSTSRQNLHYDTSISTLDPLAPFPDLASPDVWFQPCLGINPADVMPGPTPSTGASLDDIFGAGQGMQLEDPFSNLFPALPPVFNPDGTLPIHFSALTAPTRSSNNPIEPYPVQIKDDVDQMSDYEPPAFLSPSSSEYSPSFGSSRQFQTRSSKGKKRKPTQSEPVEMKPAVASTSPSDPSHIPPIDLGSPVFDAHRGIHLEDLKARAERYRLRNQGREYDKRWLLSFAGKLSSKGELIEEFRCYVVGCQQVNKRRDHILIHVGAHLDQRPFKCMHCSARFLRKNECKRHELSHTGVRPFNCHICPYPGTTFVRQDLLRRHMKRTHQLEDDKENKASTSTHRPRKKVKSF